MYSCTFITSYNDCVGRVGYCNILGGDGQNKQYSGRVGYGRQYILKGVDRIGNIFWKDWVG